MEDWSCRAAALSTVSRLRQAAAPFKKMGPIAQAATRLERALRSRWPEVRELLPRWPVLQPWRE